jgi:hypothetical protein
MKHPCGIHDSPFKCFWGLDWFAALYNPEDAERAVFGRLMKILKLKGYYLGAYGIAIGLSQP